MTTSRRLMREVMGCGERPAMAVIAIDFDGTLFRQAPRGWTSPKPAGEPIPWVIEMALQRQREGAELILWTSREGADLDVAVEACLAQGIVFDAINENVASKLAQYGPSRKVHADEYWEDRAWNPTKGEP